MRLILVPVADRPECARALNAAFDLGGRLGASVSGCHIRPHRYSDTALTFSFAHAAWRRKNTKRAPVAAKALYEKMAQAHGYEMIRRARQKPGALWAERVGSPDVVMGIVGPVCDLVVVSRPQRLRGVADMFLRAALFETNSPVLILPERTKRTVGKRVVIGWNQSKEVARTVSDVLPLLVQADEVTIVTCGPEDMPGPKSTQLASWLAHWGVKAQRISTKGRRVHPELMDAYQEVNGDLLVAGAYSHSRWRERVFGGTTEWLLHHLRAPLLTMHM